MKKFVQGCSRNLEWQEGRILGFFAETIKRAPFFFVQVNSRKTSNPWNAVAGIERKVKLPKRKKGVHPAIQAEEDARLRDVVEKYF